MAGFDTEGLGVISVGKVTVLSLAGNNDMQQATVRRFAQKIYRGGVA